MKWSPLCDQLPRSPQILFCCHISTSVLRLCPLILSQLRWISLPFTSFWGNPLLCFAALLSCLECLFMALFNLVSLPSEHLIFFFQFLYLQFEKYHPEMHWINLGTCLVIPTPVGCWWGVLSRVWSLKSECLTWCHHCLIQEQLISNSIDF